MAGSHYSMSVYGLIMCNSMLLSVTRGGGWGRASFLSASLHAVLFCFIPWSWRCEALWGKVRIVAHEPAGTRTHARTQITTSVGRTKLGSVGSERAGTRVCACAPTHQTLPYLSLIAAHGGHKPTEISCRPPPESYLWKSVVGQKNQPSKIQDSSRISCSFS